MFLITIQRDRVNFETKGRQNLQKTADFVIESIVFCPLVPHLGFLSRCIKISVSAFFDATSLAATCRPKTK